jgi:hypothetical protein
MSIGDEHTCRDDNRTASHINEFGLSVIMLEATDYLPSFAYSVGLWQKYGHPEIICFGLPTKTLHPIINDVAEIIKKGQKIETGKIYDQIFQNNRAEFLRVDKRNIGDYFAMAINYYSNYDFPALQLIWTDRNDKFPWDEDFEKEFVYKQPLLDRNADFKFREPKNLATFTTRQWLDQLKPILHIVHENDGDWQFLTGDQMPEDIRVVALEQLVITDNTLNEIFNLEYGERAERSFIGGSWTREKIEYDNDLIDGH